MQQARANGNIYTSLTSILISIITSLNVKSTKKKKISAASATVSLSGLLLLCLLKKPYNKDAHKFTCNRQKQLFSTV